MFFKYLIIIEPEIIRNQNLKKMKKIKSFAWVLIFMLVTSFTFSCTEDQTMEELIDATELGKLQDGEDGTPPPPGTGG